VTGLIGVIERVSDRKLPKRIYVLIFVVAFSLVGFFMAWREQFERAESELQRADKATQRAEKAEAKPAQATTPIQVNVPPARVTIVQPPHSSSDAYPAAKLHKDAMELVNALRTFQARIKAALEDDNQVIVSIRAEQDSAKRQLAAESLTQKQNQRRYQEVPELDRAMKEVAQLREVMIQRLPKQALEDDDLRSLLSVPHHFAGESEPRMGRIAEILANYIEGLAVQLPVNK